MSQLIWVLFRFKLLKVTVLVFVLLLFVAEEIPSLEEDFKIPEKEKEIE